MTSTPTAKPGMIRVGYAEREEMAQRLGRAHALGQLELDEFDTRVQKAYEARYRADLAGLDEDLPPETGSPDRHRTEQRQNDSRPSSFPGTRSRVGAPKSDRPWVGVSRSGSPCQGRPPGGGRRLPRPLLILLVVLAAVWLVGPIIGLLFRVLFTVLMVAGIVVLVGKLKNRRR